MPVLSVSETIDRLQGWADEMLSCAPPKTGALHLLDAIFYLSASTHEEDRKGELLEALRESQAALASIISPRSIEQTTVVNAFAQATAAEAKARRVIAKATGAPA
jgi:3-deoxy-D-manno-octulosonic-acid transferase